MRAFAREYYKVCEMVALGWIIEIIKSMPSNTIKYPKGCKPVSAGIKNTELLKRLKVLSEMLKGEATNEEADAPNRYKDLMLHLTDSQFLSNKNGDVQLLLACCIADLFRIFAPNSPLENQSLLKVRVEKRF
uniref:Bm11336 n=1 Tax=Brugia malayi TaxID=6279 RepID=A0A0J9YCL8_BRUMA|nr:Bm11336 [Brugia malayi]